MKYVARIKDCRLMVKVKVSRKEVLNEKELDRFTRLFLRGYLKPRLIKKDQIEYTGPSGVTLYERLKEPVSRRDFLYIIEQIVVAIQKSYVNNMYIHYLMMDLKKIYINKQTKELQFMYLPVEPLENGNLVDLIQIIMTSAKSDEADGQACILRFLNFYRNLRGFDINLIEQFVEREDRSVVNAIRAQNAGQSGYMTNKLKHFYEKKEEQVVQEPKEQFFDEKTGLLTDEEATGLFFHEEATGLLSDEEETGLLFEETIRDSSLGDETVLLGEDRYVRFPSLCRVLTGESISVNKPVYRIGKEKSYVDYFVTNNVAVSRSHADIITRGNKYFIIDLNSKNHTYVNDRIIPVQCEVEIFDGDRLRLANEEFIFNV